MFAKIKKKRHKSNNTTGNGFQNLKKDMKQNRKHDGKER